MAARRAHAAIAVLATGAVAIAIGSLVALFISESGGLFGFTEHGYRAAIIIAIIAEAATVLLLSPVAAINLVQTFSIDERRRPRGPETGSSRRAAREEPRSPTEGPADRRNNNRGERRTRL
jgi:MFS family permease